MSEHIPPCATTLQTKQNVFWETAPSSAHPRRYYLSLHYGRYGIEVQIDSLSENGSKSWVVISGRVDRYVIELSVECKQSMYPETVAPQNASSSTEQSVAEMALITPRFKAPRKRLADANSPPVKVPPHHLSGEVKSSVQDQGPHSSPPLEVCCLCRRHRQRRKKSQ